MAYLVYVIEDEENIRELVKFTLESYKYNVRAFETAEEALSAMKGQMPDLAIFDVMLPGMDGIQAVTLIRSSYPGGDALPIIMLTAKDGELDKVIGLDSGADDYITKPFSVLELMARIRSALRRGTMRVPEGNEHIAAQGLTIDTAAREVRCEGKLLDLTYKEYELLVYLAKNRDRVVAREELMEKIWGYNYIGESRTLDIHISSLRQKLGTCAECIKTIRNVGYRFCE